MQNEFKLSPINETRKTYRWENAAWVGDLDYGTNDKYAVVYKGNIVAIFTNLYWAKKFISDNKISLEIMKVDE